MNNWNTSDAMRTTLDIDKPILDELKRLGKSRKKTMGRLVSELLATSLKQESGKNAPNSEKAFHWNARSMGALVDIEDKDALYSALHKEK